MVSMVNLLSEDPDMGEGTPAHAKRVHVVKPAAAEEDGRATGLPALALHRQEDLLGRIGHAAAHRA